MTRPVLPQVPDVPESVVSELNALYHADSTAESSPTLDRRILDAARAELEADRKRKSRRSAPWWKGFLAPASAVAVAALGLSIALHVMDEQERNARKEMGAAEDAHRASDEAASVSKIVPVERPTATRKSISTESPAAHRVESKDERNLPSAMQDQATKPAPATGPQAFPAAPVVAAPAAAPPLPLTESLKKSMRADRPDLQEKREASEADNAGSGLATQQGKLEAMRRDASPSAVAGASSGPAAKSADDAATPEAWLKHIRELRSAGRNAEAAQSLARFRVRYPEYSLPDDLINLK